MLLKCKFASSFANKSKSLNDSNSYSTYSIVFILSWKCLLVSLQKVYYYFYNTV